MLVTIKYSKRNLKRYLRKCIAFFLFIFGILSIPLLSVVLIMPRARGIISTTERRGIEEISCKHPLEIGDTTSTHHDSGKHITLRSM